MSRFFINIPWDSQKNLGKAYNDFMRLLPNEDDYAVFIDGDAQFLTTDFGNRLQYYIDAYPECGLFTARANRIFQSWQRAGDWKSDDIKEHRKYALIMPKTIVDISDKPDNQVMSGVLIMIKKSVWEKLGGFKDGLLGVDNDIHWKAKKCGEKVYLIDWIYLYHWYYGNNFNGKRNTEHLK